MAKRRKYQFKPDPEDSGLLRKLYLTRLQRKQLLKWGLHGAVCLLMLLVQDVVMCRVHILGATTDLVVCAIFLISLLEGPENGGVFALVTSALYYFSGSAPLPYTIALIVFLAVGASLLRQSIWRRSFGSILFSAGGAFLLYELLLFALGMLMGRTIWSRMPIFVLTWAYSMVVMVCLYPLCNAIRKIGGEEWKE